MFDAAADSGRGQVTGQPSTVRHVYAHVPFCHRICPYCSFHKHTPGRVPMGEFVDAMLAEARLLAADHPLDPVTIYIGGGTPTMLSVGHLERLIEGLMEVLRPARLEEFTVEANPRNVQAAKARMLRRLGVTRVSLGVQSWDEQVLATLGRDHSPAQAERTFHTLRDAGFPSLNIDLMFSIPGQSAEAWRSTLEKTLTLGPDHISTYNLNYEEDTAFFERLRRGEFREDPERDTGYFDCALDLLGAADYRHYEISNHARPGHESRHNQAYWEGRDYAGLGPGATSTIGGRRWQNAADTNGYIRALGGGNPAARQVEVLNAEQRLTERFGLELRTASGLPLELVSENRRALLEQLAADGLLEIVDGRIRLTRPGKPLADSIAVALMDW